METVLTLSVGGLPPFSARGCIQSLTPVSTGTFRRTIQQKLVYLGSPEKKYRTLIKCTDKTAIATAGLFPGAIVEVGCIQTVSQKIDENEVVLERSPIPGSLYVDGGEIVLCDGARVVVTGGTYVTYRPILTMRILRYALSTEEWEGKSSWELEAEEL